MDQAFSVLIGCYGDFSQYSLRAVESVLAADDRGRFDLHVGCSACCDATLTRLRAHLDAGRLCSITESRRNINKDPMMRVLLEMARGKYSLWMDDDSHVAPGWDSRFVKFIEAQDEFDCAGHVFYCHKQDEYRQFLRQRPWYRSEDSYLVPEHQQRTWFATGGLFLARTEFLREHGFPDRGMIKKQDDLLLGDLISQQHGKLIGFSGEIMECVSISDGQRRGEGEGSDGWLWKPNTDTRA